MSHCLNAGWGCVMWSWDGAVLCECLCPRCVKPIVGHSIPLDMSRVVVLRPAPSYPCECWTEAGEEHAGFCAARGEP